MNQPDSFGFIAIRDLDILTLCMFPGEVDLKVNSARCFGGHIFNVTVESI